MFIIQNAWRNIIRSKGRNLLIFILTLVISLGSCLALSIRQSAETAKENGLKNLSVTAQIVLDRKGMMERNSSSNDSTQNPFEGAQELSLEEMQTYAQSSYVKGFYYTLKTSVNGSSISPIDTSSSDSSTQNAGSPPGFGQDNTPPKGMGNEGDFTVVGYSSFDAMTDFSSGVSSLTDGSFFGEQTSDPVCLISDELAQSNSLSVGSEITIANPNDTSQVYTLTVSGIFSNSNSGKSEQSMRGFSTASDPANQILMSYNSLKAILDSSEASASTETDSSGSTALRSQTDGTYLFADVDSYEAFQSAVYDMGLSEDYTVSSSDVTSYEQSLQPLYNLSSFAGWLLLLILVLGGCVLVVFQIFHIRERSYEIGVLTAMGMKKGKVLLQFLTEIFIVTFAALIIGSAAGAVASVPTTNALLSSQTSSSQPSMMGHGQMDGDMGGKPSDNENSPPDGMNPGREDTITEVTSAANGKVFIKLIGIGVILTALSGAVGAATVMRYDPLKILSSRT